jgi:hypothetical protein
VPVGPEATRRPLSRARRTALAHCRSSVIGPFDREEAQVVVGDDQVERLGRRGVGHAPSYGRNPGPGIGWHSRCNLLSRIKPRQGGAAPAILKVNWRSPLKIIWRKSPAYHRCPEKSVFQPRASAPGSSAASRTAASRSFWCSRHSDTTASQPLAGICEDAARAHKQGLPDRPNEAARDVPDDVGRRI